ncbi:hypothetical protein KIN20_033597 [Parelaphostrongylus tenuis]|uniref:Uncharacterized protein n=1 Tax=Parelaphostrongylus tenuis TaxID=148309 RepID=A0AAD5R8U0_PARTN|nr:hypothetical protein KIN20_033597 [Parelaphostrongylus tenuis]
MKREQKERLGSGLQSSNLNRTVLEDQSHPVRLQEVGRRAVLDMAKGNPSMIRRLLDKEFDCCLKTIVNIFTFYENWVRSRGSQSACHMN